MTRAGDRRPDLRAAAAEVPGEGRPGRPGRHAADRAHGHAAGDRQPVERPPAVDGPPEGGHRQLRGYGQKDPLVEYKKESYELFQDMMDRIEDETVRYLFFLQVRSDRARRRPCCRFPRMRTTRRKTTKNPRSPIPPNSSRPAAKTSMQDFTRKIQRKKEKELAELQFVGGDGIDRHQAGDHRRQSRPQRSMPLRQREEIQEVSRRVGSRASAIGVYMSMKFLVTALLLPCLASAAILPEALGDLHRASTWRPALTDRALWDEYGLKSAEAAVYENDTSKFTVTAWQLPGHHGRHGGIRVAAAGRFQSITARQDWPRKRRIRYCSSTAITCSHFPGECPENPRSTPWRSRSKTSIRRRFRSWPAICPSDGLVPNSERYVTGPVGLARFDPGDPSFGSRLPLRRGGPVGRVPHCQGRHDAGDFQLSDPPDRHAADWPNSRNYRVPWSSGAVRWWP